MIFYEIKVLDSLDEWIELIKKQNHDLDTVTSWVSCFALAVNEVNASTKIVTAPTNGAAGVIPAVLMYFFCFKKNNGRKDMREFLLVAGEIGMLFKKGATISAAAGGLPGKNRSFKCYGSSSISTCFRR